MCSEQYLVRRVIKGVFLPRFSFTDLALATLFSGCSFLVLQTRYCIIGNRGTPQ